MQIQLHFGRVLHLLYTKHVFNRIIAFEKHTKFLILLAISYVTFCVSDAGKLVWKLVLYTKDDEPYQNVVEFA